MDNPILKAWRALLAAKTSMVFSVAALSLLTASCQSLSKRQKAQPEIRVEQKAKSLAKATSAKAVSVKRSNDVLHFKKETPVTVTGSLRDIPRAKAPEETPVKTEPETLVNHHDSKQAEREMLAELNTPGKPLEADGLLQPANTGDIPAPTIDKDGVQRGGQWFKLFDAETDSPKAEATPPVLAASSGTSETPEKELKNSDSAAETKPVDDPNALTEEELPSPASTESQDKVEKAETAAASQLNPEPAPAPAPAPEAPKPTQVIQVPGPVIDSVDSAAPVAAQASTSIPIAILGSVTPTEDPRIIRRPVTKGDKGFVLTSELSVSGFAPSSINVALGQLTVRAASSHDPIFRVTTLEGGQEKQVQLEKSMKEIQQPAGEIGMIGDMRERIYVAELKFAVTKPDQMFDIDVCLHGNSDGAVVMFTPQGETGTPDPTVKLDPRAVPDKNVVAFPVTTLRSTKKIQDLPGWHQGMNNPKLQFLQGLDFVKSDRIETVKLAEAEKAAALEAQKYAQNKTGTGVWIWPLAAILLVAVVSAIGVHVVRRVMAKPVDPSEKRTSDTLYSRIANKEGGPDKKPAIQSTILPSEARTEPKTLVITADQSPQPPAANPAAVVAAAPPVVKPAEVITMKLSAPQSAADTAPPRQAIAKGENVLHTALAPTASIVGHTDLPPPNGEDGRRVIIPSRHRPASVKREPRKFSGKISGIVPPPSTEPARDSGVDRTDSLGRPLKQNVPECQAGIGKGLGDVPPEHVNGDASPDHPGFNTGSSRRLVLEEDKGGDTADDDESVSERQRPKTVSVIRGDGTMRRVPAQSDSDGDAVSEPKPDPGYTRQMAMAGSTTRRSVNGPN